ncbi:MAG: hypothetical protein H7A38_05255 [Chlamydiales bacterium]|nr:hypothetical protein [Chlamydiales bacterium]
MSKSIRKVEMILPIELCSSLDKLARSNGMTLRDYLIYCLEEKISTLPYSSALWQGLIDAIEEKNLREYESVEQLFESIVD